MRIVRNVLTRRSLELSSSSSFLFCCVVGAVVVAVVCTEDLLCRTSYYQGADKSLARPTSRCVLFDGENISFDSSLVIYM